jgi:hypothetical protein
VIVDDEIVDKKKSIIYVRKEEGEEKVQALA